MANDTKIPLFRRFVIQNFPYIEQDFDALTDYQLISKIVEYLNQVITSQNNLIDDMNQLEDHVSQLQTAFNTLQDYVDHYFDNLDVQDEINNKIDAMVANGTFSELLTPIVGDAIDNLSASVTEELNGFDGRLDTVESEVNTIPYNIKTNLLRKDSYSRYVKVTLPDGISTNLTNMFTLLKNDEKNYYVDFNRDDFVNSGGTTYYLSPNGVDTNSGTSSASAWKTFNKFKNTASAGDTLILTSGFYGKDSFNAGAGFSFSCNIIGEDDVFVATQDTTYTWTDEGGGVYSTTRSGVRKVYDITDIKNNKTADYINVETIGATEDTPMSWTQDGSTLYIHTPNGVEPSNKNTAIGLGTGNPVILFQNPTEDTKIYIKNIIFVDGNRGNIKLENNTNYNVNVLIEDCKLFNNFASNYTEDGMTNIGCNTICKNVEIYNSLKDGFNYHAGSNKQAYGVEINCTAYNFGYGQTGNGRLSNNATTAHDSCEVIRVNGNYGYCNGGVCVDVGTSKGLYYNCVAIDSYGRSYDIYASDTATIYVYDCYCKGSRATTNLLTNTNAHLYYNAGTEYDTKGGNAELIS